MTASIGTYLVLDAARVYGELERTCAPDCPRSSIQGRAQQEASGAALIATGATAAAAGLVWWLLTQSQDVPSTVWLQASPRGAWVAGSF